MLKTRPFSNLSLTPSRPFSQIVFLKGCFVTEPLNRAIRTAAQPFLSQEVPCNRLR